MKLFGAIREEGGAKERAVQVPDPALGALGHGVASLAFGFIESLPGGWRALYAFGAVPILLLAWLRRTLQETARFRAAAGAREGECRLARGSP